MGKKIVETQPIRPVSCWMSTIRNRTAKRVLRRGDDGNDLPTRNTRNVSEYCCHRYYYDFRAILFEVRNASGGGRSERETNDTRPHTRLKSVHGTISAAAVAVARRDAFNPVRKIPTVVPGGYPENYYT